MVEKEKFEQLEKIEKEKAEQERIAKEKAEQERIAKEKDEQVRNAKEKAAKEKAAKEKINAEIKDKKLTWHTDVKKAVDISLNSGKPLFFFFTGSDWCGWCIRLQKAVFFKSEFKKWASKSVVLVELDFPRRSKLPEDISKQNRELAQMFGVRGYPTVWFVSPVIESGKVTFNKLGSQGASPLEVNGWIGGANKILTQ